MPAPVQPSSPLPPWSRHPLLPPLGLVLLGVVAMGGILWNSFVQDDYGVIMANGTVHAWSGIWRSFLVPYWPPVDSGELYRPLSSAWYTVQWMLGGGSAWPFRLVSLALYGASILVVWRFLRDLTSEGAAWIGAALFAVHPVHVEAVAAAVNQSEQIVAIALLLALRLRIGANRGNISRRSAAIGIGAIYALSLLVKEGALILPGLLFVVDLFVDRDREELGARWQRWRWNYASLVLLAAAFWWGRSLVLGPGAGTDPAEAIQGAGVLARSYTMIGVPAEWLGLLLWPSHLQADWNLLEWVPTRAWSLRETAGAIAAVSFLLAFGIAWLRRPVTALGLAIVIVALAPVANVLIPSGIILAERTLFVASIGIVLVAADLVQAMQQDPAFAPVRRLGPPAVALLLALGILRSALRVQDWRDRASFLVTTAHEAPTSWHARLALGVMAADRGDTILGRSEIHQAVALRADRPLVVKEAADAIRLMEGKCGGASLIYDETLRVMPRRSDARGSMVACLIWLGRYAEARSAAAAGVELGLNAEYFQYVVGVADSADAAGAPPRSVRLRPIGNRATLIGPITPVTP